MTSEVSSRPSHIRSTATLSALIGKLPIASVPFSLWEQPVIHWRHEIILSLPVDWRAVSRQWSRLRLKGNDIRNQFSQLSAVRFLMSKYNVSGIMCQLSFATQHSAVWIPNSSNKSSFSYDLILKNVYQYFNLFLKYSDSEAR